MRAPRREALEWQSVRVTSVFDPLQTLAHCFSMVEVDVPGALMLRRTAVFGLLTAVWCFSSAPTQGLARPRLALGAHSPEVVGDWVDAPDIKAGRMHIGLHFRRVDGALRGTIEVRELGGRPVPVANLRADHGRLSFDLPPVSGHYEASWDAKQHAYVGVFTSTPGNGPLTFVRGKLPPEKAVKWSAAMAPGFTYTPGPPARARVGLSLPVGKCINLSDTLEAPVEGAWGTVVHDDDFEIIRAAGFRTVRIPVQWSAHAEESAPYRIDPAFLARVHHVVDLATAAGLNVMLNIHHYSALDAAPEANAGRFAALWRQIASSFAGAPASVWFELDNEPHDKLTNANLMAIYAPALAAIRETNRTRPVVIGGESYSGVNSLATLPLPDDPYLVPTFHYYEPGAFTHQGATWVGPNPPPIGRSYGSAADKVLLDADLQKVRDYMARTGRVPVLGEFGAQDDPRVPREQRIRYYRTISTAFASIGIQSCAWGYRVGFRLREGDHWLQGLLESIATTK
jgi:endoglucanase